MTILLLESLICNILPCFAHVETYLIIFGLYLWRTLSFLWRPPASTFYLWCGEWSPINDINECAHAISRLEKLGHDSFILDCLAMFGMGRPLREATKLPVIDPAEASLELAETLAHFRLAHSRAAYPSYPLPHRSSKLHYTVVVVFSCEIRTCTLRVGIIGFCVAAPAAFSTLPAVSWTSLSEA